MSVCSICGGPIKPVTKTGMCGRHFQVALIDNAAKADAVQGCALLQRRVQDLFVRTAGRHGCSVEAARLALLYTPAQLARMGA